MRLQNILFLNQLFEVLCIYIFTPFIKFDLLQFGNISPSNHQQILKNETTKKDVQSVPKNVLLKQNHNQNWVQWNKILPWIWLGGAWSCLIVFPTTKKAGPKGDWAYTPWLQQHSIIPLFWDTLQTDQQGQTKSTRLIWSSEKAGVLLKCWSMVRLLVLVSHLWLAKCI